MKITIEELTPTGIASVRLSHGADSQVWEMRAYSRVKDKESDSPMEAIFDEINAYWATLSAERQRMLWDVYLMIGQVLDLGYDQIAISKQLRGLVKQLYMLMPLDEIRHFVNFKTNVRLPMNLRDMYSPDDPYPPVRTYLRSDYMELVVLTVALRPMVPIWGRFIAVTQKETGTYKEMAAMALLHDSPMIGCAPMERLQNYVEHTVSATVPPNSMNTAVLAMLGSSELPTWVLAQTLVRRLAVTDVSAPTDAKGLISNIYLFITNALRSIDRRFDPLLGGRTGIKKRPSEQGDEETNSSIAENYKIIQRVSDGTIVVSQVWTENVRRMAKAIDPTIPKKMTDVCLSAAMELERSPPGQHAVVFAQYVFGSRRALSPGAVPTLDKLATIRTLAITQAALWHWGFHDLANLTTASAMQLPQDEMVVSVDTRGRISKELMDELQEIYKHSKQGRTKQHTVRQTNVGSVGIDLLCEMMVGYDWQLNSPPDLLALASNVQHRRMMVPPDIRNQLARLIIHLNATAPKEH